MPINRLCDCFASWRELDLSIRFLYGWPFALLMIAGVSGVVSTASRQVNEIKSTVKRLYADAKKAAASVVTVGAAPKRKKWIAS